jgi:predicted RNA binding protein YcfA (HicA-like mRNA interferase family)
MPKMGPVSRGDLIRHFRRLGFIGPVSGKRHQFMSKGPVKVRVPNPHVGETSVGLLRRILREAGISKAMWEQL